MEALSAAILGVEGPYFDFSPAVQKGLTSLDGDYYDEAAARRLRTVKPAVRNAAAGRKKADPASRVVRATRLLNCLEFFGIRGSNDKAD